MEWPDQGVDGPEAPPTGRTTKPPAPTKSQRHQDNGAEPGETLQWVPCTWTHAQDLRSQLGRRHLAAARSVPLDCGCRDPYPCRCTDPPLSERAIDGWRDAALHILGTGNVPLVPLEARRALYRRGGTDRHLAELLHDACGGEAA
jgi:hypothetical protein